MRVIFLDFDGVLHDDQAARSMFVHVDRLAEVLIPYPEVKLVISSSWRSQHSIELMTGHLKALGSRAIDVTPNIPDASRQAEIEAWVSYHADIDNWLAIDDMPRLFQRDCSWLLITDPKQGFDQKAWALLAVWLETGTLPTEVPSTGQIMLRQTDFETKGMIFDYALYSRSNRLIIHVPHLDSFLLTQFLIELTNRGVTGLWGENCGWRAPKESMWSIEVLIGKSLLTVKAYALTPNLSGQTTLVIEPAS